MDTNLDDTDRKILAILQVDATLSMDKIAERANLSRNACWRRIRQMETAGVIGKRVALIDPASVGLGLAVIVMIRVQNHDPTWLTQFRSVVRDMPEIIGAHRMSGDLDYMLRVRVADVAGYDRFYQRFIAKIPVADVSASFVMEDLKDTTELPVYG